jgi:hypothetical protein
LVSFLVLSFAGAAQAQTQAADHARFRGGVGLEGGALIAPRTLTLALTGVQGQLGAQINDLIGVYAVPAFDILFGAVGGVNFSGAVIADFTFMDRFTVGAGPDFDFFAGVGASKNGVSATAGGLYGARVHLAAYPVIARGFDPVRRKAFEIGLDVRMLFGGVGSAKSSTTGTSAAASSFVISPMLTIGYQAF